MRFYLIFWFSLEYFCPVSIKLKCNSLEVITYSEPTKKVLSKSVRKPKINART